MEPYLIHLLHNLKNKIMTFQKENKKIGEQDTKRILIDPLMEQLGWDVRDYKEVRSEYRHKPQDNPVDYALFLEGSPVLFIEAKALYSDLNDRKSITQTVSYSSTAGVEWCVLTNGNEYRIYNAHAPVDAEEKLFLIIKITDIDDKNDVLSNIQLLSKTSMQAHNINNLSRTLFVNNQIRRIIDDFVSKDDLDFFNLLEKRAHGISRNEIKNTLKNINIKIDFNSSDIIKYETFKPVKATIPHQVIQKPINRDNNILRSYELFKREKDLLVKALTNNDTEIIIGLNFKELKEEFIYSRQNWWLVYYPPGWEESRHFIDSDKTAFGISQSFAYFYDKKNDGEYIRFHVSVESPIKDEYKDKFKERVLNDVNNRDIDISDYEIWPYAGIQKGGKLIEKKILFKEGVWNDVLNEYKRLREFNAVVRDVIKEYRELKHFK